MSEFKKTVDNLLKNKPLLVIDVGASGGIDSRWAKFTSSYKGILFEPDPREYETLKIKSKKNLIVLNSALSDEISTLNFNLCEKQTVSSFYLPNSRFLVPSIFNAQRGRQAISRIFGIVKRGGAVKPLR